MTDVIATEQVRKVVSTIFYCEYIVIILRSLHRVYMKMLQIAPALRIWFLFSNRRMLDDLSFVRQFIHWHGRI